MSARAGPKINDYLHAIASVLVLLSVALGHWVHPGFFLFGVALTSTGRSRQRLAVDYAVHFVKATGKTRPKVFKLKVLELRPGQVKKLSRRHSFRRISTRTYYPGLHAIEILVNGKSRARAEFELVGPSPG